MKKFLLPLLIQLFFLTLSTGIYAADTRIATNQAVSVKHVFGVHGLSCPFCAIGVKKTFEKIKGVKSVDVSLKNHTVTVYTNEGLCFSDKALKDIFSKTGFQYHGTISKPKSCSNES